MQGELTDFTPFGYLRNPAHRARAWGDTEGGNLRTAPDWLGVEWAYPVGRDVSSRAGLRLETIVGGRPCQTRADFDAIGMRCRYHSCLIFGCEWLVDGVSVEARFFLANDEALCLRLEVVNTAAASRRVDVGVVAYVDESAPGSHVVTGPTRLKTQVSVGEKRHLVVVMTRGKERVTDPETVYTRLLEEDRRFFAACPTLTGDWPAHWQEGLHHDFQTTRLLVQPPGGIFKDVWPAWMAAWPRVVLAEGTLDMLRLAYADPSLASRAVLSLLRDAPEANVPCVFRDGEYNMVAADGSRCGTSPAWCLPFLNLELQYLRTLDREWLAQIFPRAAAYLEWWLANRTDGEGWLVYKCTWESGEDGNPRLDPTGSGDADISGRIRPVELQATMAHAAGVMAFLARELGHDDQRWRALQGDYTKRTSQMRDARGGRYRDWLIGEGLRQEPCPERPYWGVDACRYSAQSLTPALIDLPIDPDELRRHIAPPWTLWPSWTWSIVECAAAAGHYLEVGKLAFETIDRVYRATSRRELGSFARPMPGSSPEFWPEDWRTYRGSDAYGWGATTANLLIRHLFGFKESRRTDACVALLIPAFPEPLMVRGARYGIRRLHYRGVTFDLTYEVVGEQTLKAQLDITDGARHQLEVRQGESHPLSLR